jgi:hypothetical protein
MSQIFLNFLNNNTEYSLGILYGVIKDYKIQKEHFNHIFLIGNEIMDNFKNTGKIENLHSYIQKIGDKIGESIDFSIDLNLEAYGVNGFEEYRDNIRIDIFFRGRCISILPTDNIQDIIL